MSASDEATQLLHALLLAARLRQPIAQGEVRECVEELVRLAVRTAELAPRRRSTRRLRTHEEIGAEVARQRKRER